MIRNAVIAGTLSVLFAAAGLAADVNGHWDGSMSTPNGDFQIGFTFKVDGTKLTGSVESPNGEIPIEEGKAEGDHISFKTHFNDSEVTHEGTVSGDTIQLHVKGPWGESDMTLKRSKEKKTSSLLAPSAASQLAYLGEIPSGSAEVAVVWLPLRLS
jgi:hypothetical protein